MGGEELRRGREGEEPRRRAGGGRVKVLSWLGEIACHVSIVFYRMRSLKFETIRFSIGLSDEAYFVISSMKFN